MASLNRIFTLCPLIMLALIASPGRAEIFCNPVVEPLASDTSLVRTLSRIAEKYEFELSLPESLDQPVRFKKSMTLERLVKHLTRDMSTILKQTKVDGCATPVITHLIVLPAGKETGYVSNPPSAQEQPVDYIYIDDMESYVTNVLEGKQKAELGRMTPEQRDEYRIVRDTLVTKSAAETSRAEQTGNTEASDTGITGQTSADTTGN